jgi:hemerythrin-like domain-containing protein
MCDYCDCRSHPPIAALSEDHEHLLHLLTELDRAIHDDRPALARAVIHQLHEQLHAHAAREERGVFAELRRVVLDPGYVEMFQHDHEELHQLLDDTEGDGWRDAAASLIRVLRRHILREETDLFPAAHQMLEPAQWDAVDRAGLEPAP